MTGICSLCKEIITPTPLAVLALQIPAEQRGQVQQLPEVELLKHAMATHLAARHRAEAEQTGQLVTVVTQWALLCHFESHAPEFLTHRDQLEEQWGNAAEEYVEFTERHALQKGSPNHGPQLIEIPKQRKGERRAAKTDDSATPPEAC